jgi:hypothetical protein
MVSAAARLPVADGVNLTLMAQLAPPGRLVPHVLVCVKSVLFAPVMEMELIVSGVVPAFLNVTVEAALVVPTVRVEKLTDVGETETAVPVPLRATNCGLVGSESATLRVADRIEAAVGANLTPIVQLAPAARLVPQLFVWE